MGSIIDKLLCWLFGHDEWTESDETGPYQRTCVRCGWQHPLHGQVGNEKANDGL